MPRQSRSSKKIEALKHEEAKRKNIPKSEYQSVMEEEEKNPVRVAGSFLAPSTNPNQVESPSR